MAYYCGLSSLKYISDLIVYKKVFISIGFLRLCLMKKKKKIIRKIL
ncbi:hypothetical protein XIS1_1150016 [Xenorhabdus innexi]|uniref:Uncharacterized protein n=1 Tax=Xenorhabdus innexi TaxID=290109 RepID=A0A1N6MRL9_9GAMM|nr:hypothetical protein XIS1_1150016 [Xenorhabdus innexi]